MSYNTITVGTSATLIVGANGKRRNLTLVNTSEAVPVYIGPDSSITTANAVPLYETGTRDQDVVPEGFKGDIYGIVSTGTADVRYWEEGNVG